MEIDKMEMVRELAALEKRDKELILDEPREIYLMELHHNINIMSTMHETIQMIDKDTTARYSDAEKLLVEAEENIDLLKKHNDLTNTSNTMGVVPEGSSSGDDDENIDEFQWQEKIAEANEELHAICAEMDEFDVNINKMENAEAKPREKSNKEQTVIEEAKSEFSVQVSEINGSSEDGVSSRAETIRTNRNNRTSDPLLNYDQTDFLKRYFLQ